MTALTKAQEKLKKFDLATSRLAEALDYPESDHDLFIDATIQRFEFSYEMAWKTLKDVLALEGIQIASPKEAFRQAFVLGWISDESEWLNIIDDRNMTTHTYDEPLAREIYQRIESKHADALKKLCQLLATKMDS